MVQSDVSPSDLVQGPTDDEIRRCLDGLCERHAAEADGPAAGANLIGILQEVQGQFGYRPPAALEAISRRTRVPLSRIYGVVSFYAQFHTEPRGKHTVLCCRGTACHVKGAQRVLEALCQTLGIEDGQTTTDMLFYLETVACLGTCFLAPAMLIDNHYYGQLEPQQVRRIIKSYQAREL